MNLYELICEANTIRPLSLPFEDLRTGFIEHYQRIRRERLERAGVTQPTLFDELAVAAPTPPDTKIAQREQIAPDSETVRRETTEREVPAVPRPPVNAEFVLHLLLKRSEQDAVIGDILERYIKKHERLGERRANLWFYAEVFRSVWPLLRRAASKVGGVALLGEWFRRMIQ